MPEDLPILFDFPSRPTIDFTNGEGGERELPVVPLINAVLFPHMLTPLFVGRAPSVAAIEDAMAGERSILAVAQREQDAEDIGPADLFTVGVEALVQRVLKMPDGSTSIVVQGQRRVRILGYIGTNGYLRARVAPIYSEDERTIAVEAMMRAVLSLFERVVKLSRTLPDDSYVMAMNVDEPGWLADLVASTMALDVPRRQEILETLDTEERLRRLSVMLSQELDVLELESRIHTQVQKEVDRNQREFFLREQMKAIQRELGQDDPIQRELADLRERVLLSSMSDIAKDKALEEVDRMEAMSPATPEYSVLHTYTNWLLDLPWTAQTEDNLGLDYAALILDNNHYGLEKIKERIIEFLAVRQLAGPKLKSPIICFVGPPGVGKTSLGRSIAEALGRAFVRASLGGVHDEAEIRGHRRTYIGSMPGRVLKAMKEAGANNPVFMLDEVDKLGADFRGDPASALLEVLDPEQNDTFRDHYLDVPYDLSKVLFVTTANLLDPIPPALLDRMEVIHLPGYTEEEKFQIARLFLVPKQLDANGIEDMGVRFNEAALRHLIRHYTYEAGVRNLEREIGAVCRKIARRVAGGRSYPRVVQPRQIEEGLGRPRYSHGLAETADSVGVATGLTWSAKGGDVMQIEVMVMEGKGVLTLTGHLGDVMRESAQAALSYARANAQRLGIVNRQFERIDIHIHVPEGAIPKEGPSAGVSLATALISALSERPTRRDVAMTGEITLRGRVLPVGGVKEKVLGAHRAGVGTVILPKKNQRDLDEVPAHVKRGLRFVYVETMDEVLETALVG
ncbi:MAG: endopeptidase La [Roseiflexaceae bacterium]|nr:endopeptidase La [Roseiflexaceae bacterium]